MMEDDSSPKNEREKFCRNCGKKISVNINICDFCGGSTSDFVTNNAAEDHQQIEKTILNSTEKKDGTKSFKQRFIYWSFIFFVAGSFAIWKKNFSDDVVEKQDQNTRSEKSCADGEAGSCFDLGLAYDNGDGVIEDKVTALQFYEKACSGNHPDGCNNAGLFYKQGDAISQDMAKAFHFFQKACDGNSAAGCFNLAGFYDQGVGTGRDKAKAVALYKKSFDNYKKDCDLGEKESCFQVGLLYSDGFGVTQDMPKAAKFYQKACDYKYAKACNYLGVLFDNGEGVAKDKKRAIQLFQKACDGDDSQGCSNLGVAYFLGEGIPKDLIKAAQFYQKACDGNYAEGCNFLGVMYFEGKGVARNPDKAAQLFRKACDGNDPQGCANLSQSVFIGSDQNINLPSAEVPVAPALAPETLNTQDAARWKFNYYALENPLRTNISGSNKVLQVTLTVMTHYDDRVIKNIKTHELALRASILNVIRQKTESDLMQPNFNKTLAEEMRQVINSVLEKYEGFGGIEEVMLTEFDIQ